MELLVAIVLVFMATFTIFGVVDMIKQINKVDIKIDEDKKIPPCVGHELESQKEIEKGDIDFMHKWIQEKSGKKDSTSTKRKPKSVNEIEANFDLGGSE